MFSPVGAPELSWNLTALAPPVARSHRESFRTDCFTSHAPNCSAERNYGLPRLSSKAELSTSRFSLIRHLSFLRVLAPASQRSFVVSALAPDALTASDFVAPLSSEDSFFAPEQTSWESLGLKEELAVALKGAGLSRPSLIQAESIPLILRGKDVVVAAETGSGKTHAYLLPLIQRIMQSRKAEVEKERTELAEEERVAGSPADMQQAMLSSFAAPTEWQGHSKSSQTEGWGQRKRRPARGFGLVLCPNATLCRQVLTMALKLRAELDGGPLLQVEAIAGGEPLPRSLPDLLIATPSALLNNLFAFDPKRKRRDAFARDVKWVVLDEADMLLSGGYERHVGRLLGLFRLEEKQASAAAAVAAAAAGGGVGSVGVESPLVSTAAVDEWEEEDAEEGDRPWTDYDPELPAEVGAGDAGKAVPKIKDDERYSQADMEWTETEAAARLGGSGSVPISSAGKGEEELQGEKGSGSRGSSSSSSKSRGWRRKKVEYVRSKQYVFAAATLPRGSKKAVGDVLSWQFPEAVWVSGSRLHRQSDRLTQLWLQVDDQTRPKALLEALDGSGIVAEGSSTSNASSSSSTADRVMVFANSALSVDAICRLLQRRGIPCESFHSDRGQDERAKALLAFTQIGGVLVCTDAAARGVDIPHVGHVVQAEFSLSAVDYLHRIGRTARAGRTGRVTNLFTAASADLVLAVRRAVEEGEAVEGAFSRKRSFRKKLRKHNKSEAEAAL